MSIDLDRVWSPPPTHPQPNCQFYGFMLGLNAIYWPSCIGLYTSLVATLQGNSYHRSEKSKLFYDNSLVRCSSSNIDVLYHPPSTSRLGRLQLNSRIAASTELY